MSEIISFGVWAIRHCKHIWREALDKECRRDVSEGKVGCLEGMRLMSSFAWSLEFALLPKRVLLFHDAFTMYYLLSIFLFLLSPCMWAFEGLCLYSKTWIFFQEKNFHLANTDTKEDTEDSNKLDERHGFPEVHLPTKAFLLSDVNVGDLCSILFITVIYWHFSCSKV